MRDGLTVFVTTAYLDEAERCNRVGLMNQGRLIRCDTPAALKHSLPKKLLCETADSAPISRHATRDALLRAQPRRPDRRIADAASADCIYFLRVPAETSHGLVGSSTCRSIRRPQ